MLVGVLVFIGSGARHIVLDGRTAKPETRLLLVADEGEDTSAEENANEEFIELVDDCAATAEDAGFLLPPPPPPHEIKQKEIIISSKFFTWVVMIITPLSALAIATGWSFSITLRSIHFCGKCPITHAARPIKWPQKKPRSANWRGYQRIGGILQGCYRVAQPRSPALYAKAPS